MSQILLDLHHITQYCRTTCLLILWTLWSCGWLFDGPTTWQCFDGNPLHGLLVKNKTTYPSQVLQFSLHQSLEQLSLWQGTWSPGVLRGLLLVIHQGLPLLNWLLCKSQKDPSLTHQNCMDTTPSNNNTHIVVAWLQVSSRRSSSSTLDPAL